MSHRNVKQESRLPSLALVFSRAEHNNVLLLFHGLQSYSLSLAQILGQGEFVIRKWRRDIAFIYHQAGDAWPPVGI